jgi:hypothetical protein
MEITISMSRNSAIRFRPASELARGDPCPLHSRLFSWLSSSEELAQTFSPALAAMDARLLIPSGTPGTSDLL